MRKLLAALVLAPSITAMAPASAGPLEDATAVRARWAEAVNAGNLADVMALYTKDVLFFGASASLFKSRDALQAYLASRPPGLKVQLGDHSVVAIKPNVILSSGFVEFSVPDRQPEPTRMTLALVKVGGRWLIAQAHTSPLPSR